VVFTRFARLRAKRRGIATQDPVRFVSLDHANRDGVVVSYDVEGPEGFEPSTRGLRGLCSNQLSYGPAMDYGILACSPLFCKRC
jgi:hypothetical protein